MSTTWVPGGTSAATSSMSRPIRTGNGAWPRPAGSRPTRAGSPARDRPAATPASRAGRRSRCAPGGSRPAPARASARAPPQHLATTAPRAARTSSRSLASSRSNRRVVLGTTASPGTTAAARASPQCFADATPRLNSASARRCQIPTADSTRLDLPPMPAILPAGPWPASLRSLNLRALQAVRPPSPNCRVVRCAGEGGSDLPPSPRTGEGLGVGACLPDQFVRRQVQP